MTMRKYIKICILLFISLIFTNLSNAQNNHEKLFLKQYVKGNGETSTIYLGFSAHVGLPSGDFGTLDSATIGSNIAAKKLVGMGVGGAFEVRGKLGEKVRLGLTGGYTSFGQKEETINLSDSLTVLTNTGKASTISAALTFEYLINNRLFVGLDAGMYITKTENEFDSSGASSALDFKTSSETNKFGFAPKIGANFGNIFVNGKYHLAGDTKFISFGVGYLIPVD
ncbi:MAG: hypothetical protein OHK0038_06780 [Flammeovirgaceae bacterium]